MSGTKPNGSGYTAKNRILCFQVELNAVGPESPFVALLPISAGAASLGGLAFAARRRRTRRA